MDLDELRAFLRVIDEGSLARAATALLVSRTTIRRRIEALEARVGAPLFAREQGRVETTDAGRLLAARGRILVRESESLAEALRDLQGEPVGVFRVAVPPGLPPFLVPMVLSVWRARYPRLVIDLTVTEDPLRALHETADVAMVFGPVDASGPFAVLPVVPLREWFLASDAYLARRGVPRTIDEMAGHEILVWRSPDRDPRLLPSAHGPLSVEACVVSGDVHWLRHCARAGMGLVYLPDALLPDPDERSAPLRPVLPDLVGRRLEGQVVFSRTRTPSLQMRAVLSDLVPAVERARDMLTRMQSG